MNTDFLTFCNFLRNARVPHSIDWGSDWLRSKEHQKFLIDEGFNLTILTLNAVVIQETYFVFSTCEGKFLFTTRKYGKPQRREEKITLNKEGLGWITTI